MQPLILLPPSETKRDGGNSVLSANEPLGDLSWPALQSTRIHLAHDLMKLSADELAAAKALKISAKLASSELARNRSLLTGPRMAALDRYTGVLFDALDAASLEPAARAWAEEHVVVHSALFGLVRGGDAIPAYRCSADSRVPAQTMRARWGTLIRDELRDYPGVIIDLRSKGYVALGPIEAGPRRLTAHVVQAGPDGELRALNHFNKQGKGAFVREVATLFGEVSEGNVSAPASVSELLDALRTRGIDVRDDLENGSVTLVVETVGVLQS